MAGLKNYSIDTVHVSFNRVMINQGLLEVSVAMESEAFDWAVGSGGEVARIRRIDNRGRVTVRLMGTSSDNLILSAFHTADARTPNGTGVGILYIEQGNDKFIAEKAWIVKAPDRTFGVESIGECEWVFACGDLKRVDGGSSEA